MSLVNIGWDIGGAHLKTAVLDQTGAVIQVYQQPCPLWKGLNQLTQAVQQILIQLPPDSRRHFITMTGELVDLFPHRNEGIRQIIAAMQAYLINETIWIYASEFGFVPINAVTVDHYPAIASANWLASASWVAKKIDAGLFVDIGSTTTDILGLNHHLVDAVGFTDAQRLQSQELLYTGVVRTAVMAVTQTAFFNGQLTGLMAEYFATMADVYRLTGDLHEAHDQSDTADGAEKTIAASGRRLARMLGYEFAMHELAAWQQFAFQLKYQQKQQIQLACLRQYSRNPAFKLGMIGAGIGRFLVRQIASDLGCVYRDVNDLFNPPLTNSAISAADCAPAVAVADLGRHWIMAI
jgi:probable H4MPT-linked C1 transfer pathway protein